MRTRPGSFSEPTLPGLFLTWANLRELDYPKELEKALEARGHTFADMKKIADDLRAIIAQLTGAERSANAAE